MKFLPQLVLHLPQLKSCIVSGLIEATPSFKLAMFEYSMVLSNNDLRTRVARTMNASQSPVNREYITAELVDLPQIDICCCSKKGDAS